MYVCFVLLLRHFSTNLIVPQTHAETEKYLVVLGNLQWFYTLQKNVIAIVVRLLCLIIYQARTTKQKQFYLSYKTNRNIAPKNKSLYWKMIKKIFENVFL